MIDIREIRIGDVLINTVDNVDCVVESIDRTMGIDSIYAVKDCELYVYPKENYCKIPIAEDLLLQLGFQKEVDEISRKEFYMYLPNGFRVDINKYSNTLGRDYGIHIDNLCSDSVLSGDIQYLHQLQNYIYDSTKQELDITNII